MTTIDELTADQVAENLALQKIPSGLRTWLLAFGYASHRCLPRAGLLDDLAGILAARDRLAVSDAVEAAHDDEDGPLPDYDSPLRETFEDGVEFTLTLFARALEVDSWNASEGDGSLDEEVSNEIRNILRAAKLIPE